LNDGVERFAARYPRVWHVIEADGAGPWLQTMGLLPAEDLHRLAGNTDAGGNRDDFRRLDLGQGRVAVLRPQLMADRVLTATLGGSFMGRPDLWRRLINSHVFFWLELRRRDSFIRACGRLRAASHITPQYATPNVLAIDTAALLSRYGDKAFYTRINSGAALRGGARTRRDETTLRRVADYRSGAVAELAIAGRVELRGITVRAIA
jgi:hypothetical protein